MSRLVNDHRLEAEAFLLKPVIEFLRGYTKITRSAPALLNAEDVLQEEIDNLLSARIRVLEAFSHTVESEEDPDSRYCQEDSDDDNPPRGRSRWRFGPPGSAPDYKCRSITPIAGNGARNRRESHTHSEHTLSQSRHKEVMFILNQSSCFMSAHRDKFTIGLDCGYKRHNTTTLANWPAAPKRDYSTS